MAHELADPEIVRESEHTVVGLTTRGGADADFGALWNDVLERVEEFEAIATAEESYGVSYDYDPETGELSYLAGVPTDPDVDVPDEASTIDLPAGTYATFTTTLADIGETMEAIHGQWLPAADHERAAGPEFERYPPGFDPTDLDETFEVYVPIVEG